MDARTVYVAVALAALMAGCGGGSSASEDERGSVGVPPPPSAYCTDLGFTIALGQCQFPDGTSCESWAFYRGECGHAHSYCNQHGGTVSSKTKNMGTWTAVYAGCDLNGRACEEAAFMHTGKCE